MLEAFINRIATAKPPHDVHDGFLRFGQQMLKGDNRRMALFDRMADRCGISHRYSFFEPGPRLEDGGTAVDAEGFYRRGAFPDTGARMQKFEAWAPGLAVEAVEKLLQGEDRSRITHVIVTSCTGFSAPGIDLALIERSGLPPSVERTMVGFMGCYAAITALKLARHIVRSEPDAPSGAAFANSPTRCTRRLCNPAVKSLSVMPIRELFPVQPPRLDGTQQWPGTMLISASYRTAICESQRA